MSDVISNPATKEFSRSLRPKNVATAGIGHTKSIVKKLFGGGGTVPGPGIPVTSRDGTVDASRATTNPDLVAAAVTRNQWQDYLNRYRPRELEALDVATDMDFQEEGDRAGLAAQAQSSVATGALIRQLGRSGTSLNAEQRAGLSRRQAIAGTQGTGGAENNTRRDLKTRNVNTLGELVAIGRGIQNTANSGLSQAATLASQRTQANENASNANKNTNLQVAGTLGAAAIVAFA